MKKTTLGILFVGLVCFGVPALAQDGGAAGGKKPPTPQSSPAPAQKKAPPAKSAPHSPTQGLDAVDAAEVQRYSDALTNAALAPEDVKALVQDATKELLAKKQKKALAGGPKKDPLPPPAGSSAGGLRDFVQGLLDQGLRGQPLADAIHAEQKHRQGGPDRSAAKADGSGKAAPAAPSAKPPSSSKAAPAHGQAQGGHKPASHPTGKSPDGDKKI